MESPRISIRWAVCTTVEDAVGDSRIAELFVPAGHRQQRRENQRANLAAVFANLPEVSTVGLRQRRHGPIIDYQHIDPAQSPEQIAEASARASARSRNSAGTRV